MSKHIETNTVANKPKLSTAGKFKSYLQSKIVSFQLLIYITQCKGVMGKRKEGRVGGSQYVLPPLIKSERDMSSYPLTYPLPPNTHSQKTVMGGENKSHRSKFSSNQVILFSVEKGKRKEKGKEKGSKWKKKGKVKGNG